MLEKTTTCFIQLITLCLMVIIGNTSLFGQSATANITGISIPSQSIQPPTTKKLAAPITTKAGQPIVLSLKHPKKALVAAPSEQLAVSKTINVSIDGQVQPFITPLVENPQLAGIPEKVLAQKSLKKNTDNTSLLTYDLTNGLRDMTIGRQYQDRDNNLWTASIYSGAYKFDGKYFHYFTEAQGLSSNSVRTMAITQNNELWFGTLKGVTKYDGQYTTHYNTENGLLNDWALHVEEGTNNTMWIGTMDGPQMIDKSGKVIYSFPTIPALNKQVFDLKVDHNGHVWIAFNPNSLAVIVPQKNENGYSFKVHLFLQDFMGLGLYFYEDQAKKMWLATLEGLFRFAPFNENKKALAFKNYDTDKRISKNRITRITQHKNQNIYLSTRQAGVYILHQDAQAEFSTYTNLTAPNQLPDNFIGSIFKDKQQNLWIGSAGLSVLKNSPFQIFNQIKNPNCLLEDAQKHIWIGTTNGLYKYHPETPDRLLKYTQQNGLPNNDIVDLAADELGNIWIATNKKGLIIFDIRKNQFIQHTEATGLPSNGITKFTKDKQGKIWFSTYHDKIDVITGLSTITDNQLIHLSMEQGLVERDVMTMNYDKFGNFWLASWGKGISKLTIPSSLTQKPTSIHYSSQQSNIEDRIRAITVDAKGNVWIGGYGSVGVSQFIAAPDGNIRDLKQYSLAEGLTSTTVESALADVAGNIWFGTPNGLNVLPANQIEQVTSSRPILQFTEVDGFPAKSCRRNVLFQSSDGTIWVGGDDYLITFDPKVLLDKPPTPTIVLNEVSLYNQSIDWQKDTTLILGNNKIVEAYQYDNLASFTNIPEGLSLAYDNNFIDFDYGGISIDNYRKITYQTYLEDLESDWSIPTKEAKISYNGLSPGSYTFKVRAKIDGGDWGVPLEYPFVIRPPWWLTWWAYFAYAISTVALLYFAYAFFSSRKLAKAETQRLTELDLVKSRLYTNITHEFRTPLTVIAGMASKMEQAPSEWTQKGIPMIKRNSEQLLSLVNQLLDLSKLESGKTALNYQQGNIVNYLKYITESIQSLAASKAITVHFLSEEDTIMMDFDEDKIQRILINLLSNAIKFTPSKGHIYVSIARKLDNSIPTLQLKVKDTGRGIAEDQLPFIFDRFYQIDNSTTRQGEGTGIGLALVKELVLVMDGAISVKSKVHKETTFSITLPIKQEATEFSQLERSTKAVSLNVNQEATNAAVLATTARDNENEDRRPSVLVIEDNEDVVAYIVSCLQDEYVIQVGSNGEEGIDIALEKIPDLILTDIMMPVKDGIEVCQTLKQDERTSHIPIIMLTAKADMDSKLEGLTHGADAYLSKPFNPKELLIRLAKLIENRKRLQAKYSSAELITTPTPKTADIFLQKAQQAILENLDIDAFGPNELAEKIGVSRTQLHRKLKALTGLSASRYINKIRVQEGKRLLATTDKTISEIAYAVGFTSLNYFSTSFSKEFGVSPRVFRNGLVE